MENNNDLEMASNRRILIYILITVATLLMLFYIIRYFQMKSKTKTEENYLIQNNIINNKVTSILELKQVLSESPNKLVLYLSYHNSKKMYDFEKKIAEVLKEYDTTDVMYIYDITTLKEKVDNYKEVLDDTLDINVSSFPVIIIYEDGQISSYKIIKNVNDIKKLFKKYNIEKK